ncbi:hypothetical protein DOY81_008890 [Sarcophaga bullata]|nr:hypothetical protein DOY81_008890 [Sarcophaga bullata]
MRDKSDPMSLSTNAQICDHEYKILSINSKCGGASHDSFVWKQSDERRYLEELYNANNLKNVWLLGGSGYTIEPWLITPYKNPEKNSQKHILMKCMYFMYFDVLLKEQWEYLELDGKF